MPTLVDRGVRINLHRDRPPKPGPARLPQTVKPHEPDDPSPWGAPEVLRRYPRLIAHMICQINCASASTMNTALQFILDRRVGEHVLGRNVRQIACVNRAEHRAHVNPMSAPLINRFLVLEVLPNLEEWMKWAMMHNIHEAVIGYLNYRAEALYHEPKKVQDEFANSPSPRSWERVSRLISSGMADFLYLKGCIGEGAAVELSAYLKDRNDMPDIDRLLEGEVEWDPIRKKPSEGKTKLSVVYAVTAALGDRVIRNPALMEPAAAVLLRIQPEIASLFLSMLMNSPVKNIMRLVTGSKGLCAWLKKHQKLISRAIAAAA